MLKAIAADSLAAVRPQGLLNKFIVGGSTVVLRFTWKIAKAFRLVLLVVGGLVLGLTTSLAQQTNVPAPSGGGVASAEPSFHLIRSICGSKGSQKGDHFVMEDPRSVFYLPEDKQVMIYFEWEGATGQHHFEGFWKNPEGKVVVLSDFSYEAKQKRFAGYWALPLTDSMAPGMWVMEAHVDGELAGTYNFQIAVAPRPPLPTPRPDLTPADIYKKLLAATVSVERLDRQHRRLGLGSGFIVEGNLIVTTFENVESASSVRISLANGQSTELDGLVAWSRRQDWAVLRFPAPLANALAIAKAGSWQIGDTCYSLDSAQEGNRTILSGNITGSHNFPDVGERWNLNFRLSPSAGGSPVVTEYGEVIGIASSASLIPGLSSLESMDLTWYPGNMASQGMRAGFDVELALPMSVVKLPPPEIAVTTFAEMMKTGQVLESLVKNENLFAGTLGRSIERSNQQVLIKDERFEFQRRDEKLSALITWSPHGKLKTSAVLMIYDIDNKLVGTTQPVKVNLSKAQLAYTFWTVVISNLPPGLYRVDMVLDTTPVWRTFFRITE